MKNEKKELKDRTELNENELDMVTGGALRIVTKAPPCANGGSCHGRNGCDQYDSCTKSKKIQ